MCFERKGGRFNHHEMMQPGMEHYPKELAKVLPILAFVTSVDESSIIAVIEKFCLEDLNSGDLNPAEVVINTSDEKPLPIYDFWFWEKECELKEVFSCTNGDRGRFDLMLLHDFPTVKYPEETNERFQMLLTGIVDDVINTGRITGVSKEIIMAAVDKLSYHLLYTCSAHISQYSGMFWLYFN